MEFFYGKKLILLWKLMNQIYLCFFKG